MHNQEYIDIDGRLSLNNQQVFGFYGKKFIFIPKIDSPDLVGVCNPLIFHCWHNAPRSAYPSQLPSSRTAESKNGNEIIT